MWKHNVLGYALVAAGFFALYFSSRPELQAANNQTCDGNTPSNCYCRTSGRGENQTSCYASTGNPGSTYYTCIIGREGDNCDPAKSVISCGKDGENNDTGIQYKGACNASGGPGDAKKIGTCFYKQGSCQ
jgi:hypothetical protein